jgi:hypothetical protein
VKVTPYGFVLANGFWSDNAFVNRDYPGQAVAPGSANWNSTTSPGGTRGGAFVLRANQSRFGVRLALKDDNWTGAEFAGTIEFDFKGGYLPGNPTCTANTATPPVITCTQGTTASSSYNAGLMRLRIATAAATWKTPYGTWTILGGQDYGLVNPLFAESISYVADPIFWQAGNIWRRTPQFRLTFDQKFGAVGLNLAAAILSPADREAPVDFGAGNRSRQPDIEARGAISAKPMPDVSATVGVGYHTNKRRYFQGATNERDVTATVLGVDADLNLTKFLQVKGEYYTGKGADDSYNAIGPGTLPIVATPAEYLDVATSGYWAQAILKPLPIVSIVAGYGMATVDKDDLARVVTTANQPATRQENTQLHGGIIFNAGKFWRFGVEAVKTDTTYLTPIATNAGETKFSAMHYALSSMFRF